MAGKVGLVAGGVKRSLVLHPACIQPNASLAGWLEPRQEAYITDPGVTRTHLHMVGDRKVRFVMVQSGVSKDDRNLGCPRNWSLAWGTGS